MEYEQESRREHDAQAQEQRVEAALERLLLLVEKVERKLELPPQEWFSIEETAALTRLSADFIRRHVTTGLLPVSNMGTFDKPYYRIHRKDIEAWMAKRRETPQPAPRKRKKAEPGPGSYVSRHHQPKTSAV
jgi:excisionase family DNA binding protein